MVIKLSDIFKGNLEIIQLLKVYTDVYESLIFINGSRTIHSSSHIPLSSILKYGINIRTTIQFRINGMTRSYIKCRNGNLTIHYRCIECGNYIKYDDKIQLLCKNCAKEGMVLWQ